MAIKETTWLEYTNPNPPKRKYCLGSRVWAFEPDPLHSNRRVENVGDFNSAKNLWESFGGDFSFYYPDDPQVREANFWYEVDARREEIEKHFSEQENTEPLNLVTHKRRK